MSHCPSIFRELALRQRQHNNVKPVTGTPGICLRRGALIVRDTVKRARNKTATVTKLFQPRTAHYSAWIGNTIEVMDLSILRQIGQHAGAIVHNILYQRHRLAAIGIEAAGNVVVALVVATITQHALTIVPDMFIKHAFELPKKWGWNCFLFHLSIFK